MSTTQTNRHCVKPIAGWQARPRARAYARGAWVAIERPTTNRRNTFSGEVLEQFPPEKVLRRVAAFTERLTANTAQKVVDFTV